MEDSLEILRTFLEDKTALYNEDLDRHLENVLNRLDKLEKENIRLRFQDIPYLEGNIKGQRTMLEEVGKENKELKSELEKLQNRNKNLKKEVKILKDNFKKAIDDLLDDTLCEECKRNIEYKLSGGLE